MLTNKTKAASAYHHQAAFLNLKKQQDNTKNCFKKRYAPYSKRLISKINPAIFHQDVWLFAGKWAWKFAKVHEYNGHVILVLPNKSSPDNFIWPVRNFDILIIETSKINYQILRRLAFLLLFSGAKIVRLVTFDLQIVRFGGHKID